MTETSPPGGRILAVSRAGTVAFVAVSAVGVVGSSLGGLVLVVDAGLALAGCVAFLAAYLQGLHRSRTDEVGVASLFFLPAGVAPPLVRRSLLGDLVVQVAVALAAAFARPYTILAAGILVPLFGTGMCGLWAARHGTFAPRNAEGNGG